MSETPSIALRDLVERAYPEGHDLVAIRYALYSEKHGETFPADLRKHIEECAYCRQKIEIMKATDPILTGEWDEKIKTLVDAASTPEAAKKVEERASKVAVRISKGIAKGAVTFVGSLVSANVGKAASRTKSPRRTKKSAAA